MNVVDALNEFWNTILQVTELFVIPDWGALINLLPVFIFLGVVGPFITFFVLGTLIYQLRKPRVSVSLVEGPRAAALDDQGQPAFPVGLPYCRRDALVFASGTHRCDVCHETLAVTCPMCGTGRTALADTCSDCGLVLKVKTRATVVRRSSGPRPGGAAAA